MSRTLVIFDTVGSYFVDVFYNHHYSYARQMLNSQARSSLTDAYRDTVANYMNALAHRPDLYKKTVQQVFDYYCTHVGSTILSEFQDRFLSQFIPEDYYRNFTEKQKDTVMADIIIRSVNDLGAHIVQKMLARVIDNHRSRENVIALQDKMTSIFMSQRDDYYMKFVTEIRRRNVGQTVSVELFQKVKEELVDKMGRISTLEVDRTRAINIIQNLTRRIMSLEARVQEMAAAGKQVQSAHSVQTVQNVQNAQPAQTTQNVQPTTEPITEVSPPPCVSGPDSVDFDPWTAEFND